ncbi:MAG TPA: hypothetical protein VIN60_07705, partial [Anaerolineales bacterium]
RASTYRGQKQLTLQFKEFRVIEEKPVEIRRARLEIRDWRLENKKFESLKVGMLVWAEGNEKAKGKSRFDLCQADEFAIYTTPPSPAELRAVLEIVKPKTIYLFAVSPETEKTDEFLSRLAGMAKFALHQRGGKVSVRELAVATAQREAAIRLGLEWLAAGAHIKVEGENGELNLANDDGIANQYLQSELYIAVKGLLEEAAAYRAYFAKADSKTLFEY